MSTKIQVRNVPERLHRRLKVRAAASGKSLSSYILGLLEEHSATPTWEEFLERLETREPVDARPTPAEVVREERDAR